MKNVFYGLISKLDIAKLDMTLATSKTEKQRGKKDWKKPRISKDSGTMTKGITYTLWEHQKEKKEKITEEIFEAIMTENFPQINAIQI